MPAGCIRDYHQDQNSTLTVRAIRRFTMSRRRRSPQKTFPCPLISGFRRRSPFSISVVMVTVLGARGLRVVFAEAPCDCPVALEVEPGPWAAIAMDFTFP